MVETKPIDCSLLCKDGCSQPDRCQNAAHVQSASKFINATSLDDMHEIAESARRNAEVVQAMGMGNRIGAQWRELNERHLSDQLAASDASSGIGTW